MLNYVRRIESGTGALRELIAESQRLAKVQGPVTDATGSVRVTLDDEGVPVSIELGPDWRRLVGAEGLASAVTEACQDAVTASAMAFATASESDDWRQRSEELLTYFDGTSPPPPWLEASQARQPQSTPEVPPVVTIADLEDLTSRLARDSWTGVAAQGRLSLTIDLAGVVTCQADPGWVSRQDTQTMNDSLATALAAARGQRPTWDW